MKRTIFAAVITLFCVSCAEDIAKLKNQQVPLNIDAVSQGMTTRSGSDIQGATFDAGELINTYISVTGASDNTTTLGNPLLMKTEAAVNGINTLATNDGSTLYFPPGDNVNVSIYAHYPQTVSLTDAFTVRVPQKSEADYKASDLMYASASSEKTEQPVHLQFAHKMAKLVINATGEEGLTMKKITLKTVYTSIAWTPETGVLGALNGEKQDIIIAEESSYQSSLSGVALFPPQTKDDTYFLEVEAKNSEGAEGTAVFYVCTKDFESGRVYTVNMKIGPKNLVAGEDGKVTIAPWPASVGTINIQAVGNLGMKIESLADDGKTTTNTLSSEMIGGTTSYYYTYNGKECTPVPTVTDGKESGATTIAASNYDVKYYNNINAGTALMVVTGKGEYEGLSTFTTFTVKKAANTMAYPAATKNVNLSRDAIVPHALTLPNLKTSGQEVYGRMTYKIYSNAAMTVEHPTSGDNCIATVDANGNVYMKKKGGPIYVKASMDDSGNFVAKEVSYALTITAGDIASAITIEWSDGKADGQETWPFTGLPVRPAFRIMDNGNSLAGAETSGGYDYNYTYSNNVTVGNNTAVLTITGQGEYSGTKTFKFSITKVDNSWVSISEPTVPIDCGATATSPQGNTTMTLSLPAGTFATGALPKFGSGTNYTGTTGSVTYSTSNSSIATVNASGVITGKAVGTCKITATVAGTTNYNELKKEINVTVEKMSHIFVYNGTTELSGYYFQARNGSAQSYNVTFAANATLMACLVGAGGGNDGTGRGGQGGLVVAKKTFTKGTTLQWYVFCGGGGESNTTGSDSDALTSLGGWPGGARPGTTGSSGGGGGATALCTTNSTDNWNFTNTDSRMLVAGAGGGSSNGGNGGEPGGPQATNDGENPGSMITYAGSTRKKWMGGRAYVSDEIYAESVTQDGGSGGAGYYGGRGGAEVNSGNTVAAGGHGGSNYIKSDWTAMYNGLAGSEVGTTYSATTVTPFTIAYNGHKKSEDAAGITRVWPGYVLIKYTYD